MNFVLLLLYSHFLYLMASLISNVSKPYIFPFFSRAYFQSKFPFILIRRYKIQKRYFLKLIFNILPLKCAQNLGGGGEGERGGERVNSEPQGPLFSKIMKILIKYAENCDFGLGYPKILF